MDLKFYEMHYEDTANQQKLEGNSYNNSMQLVVATDKGEVFCSLNDKVYHLAWNKDNEELDRRLCYHPIKDTSRMPEVILLDVLSGVNATILAVVYFHGGKYTLSVFQVDVTTLKIKLKQEENLHSKPNLVKLSLDLYSSNTTVILAYYTQPTVQVIIYTDSGCLTRVEDPRIRECYPTLFRCMNRGTLEKRSLHHRGDFEHQTQDKRLTQDYILCINVMLRNKVRYMAYGMVDGNVHVHVSNTTKTLWTAVYDWEGPISAVTFFEYNSMVCLVATCMVEQAVLFTDIDNMMLDNRIVLPESTLFDSITCVRIMDIDYDGKPEIILGTYGKMLLVYKLDLVEGRVIPHIVYRRQYNSPLFVICYSDLTCDGLYEIVILTFNGIHVLQRCLRSAQLYIQKLISLTPGKVKCPLQDEHNSSGYLSTPE